MLHRYRPMSIDDLNTPHATLYRSLVSLGSIHLLILGGPGSGKSTTSRILIREYYEEADPDVLYISNLKEQGMNYYRNDVKCFCQTTCTVPSKKKTVAIDDLDTISELGQQVFLNFLDKYGKSTQFIATACQASKVIVGLHSRLLCIQLHPFSHEYLERILVRIATQEGVVLDQTESFIVARSQNSVRNLINYIEKFKVLGKEVTRDVVNACCTNIDGGELDAFLTAVMKHDTRDAITRAFKMVESGYSVMDVLDAIFLYLKSSTLPDSIRYGMTRAICKYIVIFNQVHEHTLELAFFVNDMISLIPVTGAHPVVTCGADGS